MEKTFEIPLKIRRIGILLCFTFLFGFHAFYALNDMHYFSTDVRSWAYICLGFFIFSAFSLFWKTGIAYWGTSKWNFNNKKSEIEVDERQIHVVNNAHRQGYILLGWTLIILSILEKYSTKSDFMKIGYSTLVNSMIFAWALIPLAIIAWQEKEV